MYHCIHCHTTSNEKAGWYFDGIGGAWCQNCVFLALELLDQDPPDVALDIPDEVLAQITDVIARHLMQEAINDVIHGPGWDEKLRRYGDDPPIWPGVPDLQKEMAQGTPAKPSWWSWRKKQDQTFYPKWDRLDGDGQGILWPHGHVKRA